MEGKEGTLTWGWATRILRQCVEGTAVMKVSAGTAASGHAHRPQRVTAPSPAGTHRCPHGHPPGVNLKFHTWNAAGMQRGRGSSFVSQRWSPRWVLTQLQTGYPGFPWISMLDFTGLAALRPCRSLLPPFNPSFMAKRGPLAVHILRALVAAAPQRGQPCLPVPLSSVGF